MHTRFNVDAGFHLTFRHSPEGIHGEAVWDMLAGEALSKCFDDEQPEMRTIQRCRNVLPVLANPDLVQP